MSECESAAAVLRGGVKNTQDSLQRMLLDMGEQETRVRELREQIESNQARITALQGDLKAVSDEITSNSNILDGCRIKLKSREENLQLLSDRATKLAVDGRSMDGRIRMLSEMEKDYEGYSRAVKTVMQGAGRGTLRGVHRPVANLVRANDECALAIETALGAAAQNIVVDTQNDGRSAIELLKKRDAGRATFLPVDTIRQHSC